MPVPLTPELAAKMLDVWNRRLKHPRGTQYVSTLLEAALGAPDFGPDGPPDFPVSHRPRNLDWHPRRGDTEWLK